MNKLIDYAVVIDAEDNKYYQFNPIYITIIVEVLRIIINECGLSFEEAKNPGVLKRWALNRLVRRVCADHDIYSLWGGAPAEISRKILNYSEKLTVHHYEDLKAIGRQSPN